MGNLVCVECFSILWNAFFASFKMFSPCVFELLVLLYHLSVKEITPLVNNNMKAELWPHRRPGGDPCIPADSQAVQGFVFPFVMIIRKKRKCKIRTAVVLGRRKLYRGYGIPWNTHKPWALNEPRGWSEDGSGHVQGSTQPPAPGAGG